MLFTFIQTKYNNKILYLIYGNVIKGKLMKQVYMGFWERNVIKYYTAACEHNKVLIELIMLEKKKCNNSNYAE
jgi:hypothetical protein